MQSWNREKFPQKRNTLEARAEIIKKIRAWFGGEGFIEVQTPVLQVMGAPDAHIKPFQTDDSHHSWELHTSPEIAMKKLLVSGMDKIFQICPVFRKGNHSSLHSAEFTMLEWYRTSTDYTAMMDDCEALVQSLGLFKDAPFERLSVADAFQKYAQIELNADLKKAAQSIGVRIIETDTFEDIFHAIMAEKIEPNLGQGRPMILYDYPPSMAALAKKRGDIAERFELYINGIEIANAFSELTDPIEQRARLEEDLALKKELYGIETPLDEDFIAALEHGMPESSGCALGLDRLVMIACRIDDIGDVQWM